MPQQENFLRFLRFDEKLTNTLIGKYLANPRLVILLLIVVVTVGINAFLTLPRALNPEVQIPIVVVSTVLPGASPADIERLITIPIEKAVNSVENVGTITSSSRENSSTVTIEFDSGVDPDDATDKVRSAIDTVRNLPEDATDPNVIKVDFENYPIWNFVLTGDSDTGSLFKFAEVLVQRLEDLPQIDEVAVAGIEDTEIHITIDPGVYAPYGINPQVLSGLVTTSFRSFPAGTIRSDTSSFALTIDPQVATIEDIRDLRLNLNGINVALSDIAKISEMPKPEQTESYIAKSDGNPRRAVTFNIYRANAYDIDESYVAAENIVSEELLRHPNFESITLVNSAEEVGSQFESLTRDFMITVVLVVLVLFLFLGLRQALIASLSIPLSFLITFAVMNQMGITLNFLSLFSLILTLGLLVDDTVVITTATSAYYKTRKFTPYQVGLMVWRDYLAPIITTTVTTVWAFLPLLLASGIIGEFIKSIPIVVSTALVASTFVGLFIILPLIVIFLSPQIPRRVVVLLRILAAFIVVGLVFTLLPKGNLFILEIILAALFAFVLFTIRGEIKPFFVSRLNKTRTVKRVSKWFSGRNFDTGIISFDSVRGKYNNLIQRILISRKNRRMVVAMVVIFFIFSFLLLPLGFVKNEFFPKVDADILYVSVEYPTGTHVEESRANALELLGQLREEDGVNFVSFDVGSSISMESGSAVSGGANNVLFSLNLIDESARTKSFDIAEKLRSELSSYQKGDLSVIEQSGGPPVGADIQIKLLGSDLALLNEKADLIVAFLDKNQATTNVEKSVAAGTGKLVFAPNYERLAQSGISIDQLGYWLRLYASGINFESNQFPGDTDEQDITLRLYDDNAYVASLNQILIPTQNGNNVSLAGLGSVRLSSNPTLITREDGNRTMSVSAAVRQGFNLTEINQELERFADSELGLPNGYSWQTGGVNEENEASINSILIAMLLSFILIVATMVIQFNSFRRAIVVMLVIPLSISGVFIMFALTGTPLSFPALIGVLALFGIVVKNSILVVDKTVENIKIGKMPYIEAISTASASRLEPIALTSISTVIGLIPITLTDPLWRGLGGAVIAGLTVSGVIMLFFIPVVYYIFMDGGKQK